MWRKYRAIWPNSFNASIYAQMLQGQTTMIDTKDSALELAKECGFFVGTNISGIQLVTARTDGYNHAHITAEELTTYYNDARKPLEEENAYLRTSISALETRVTCMELNEKSNHKQLIATQEAYQRTRDFLLKNGEHENNCYVLYLTEDGVHGECTCGLANALAKTPVC